MMLTASQSDVSVDVGSRVLKERGKDEGEVGLKCPKPCIMMALPTTIQGSGAHNNILRCEGLVVVSIRQVYSCTLAVLYCQGCIHFIFSPVLLQCIARSNM